MEKISRKEAKAQGKKTYYTGMACKHGHICERVVTNGSCKECMAIKSRKYSKLWYEANREYAIGKQKVYSETNKSTIREYQLNYRAENKEKARNYNSEYYQQHKECAKQDQREYYAKNFEKYQQYRKDYYNTNREQLIECGKIYREENKQLISEKKKKYYETHKLDCKVRNAARRKRTKQATPIWANEDAIQEIYTQCQLMNETSDEVYVVDHIIPLRGKAVCGLHVESNLRIITQKENAAKSNKLLTE